MGTELVKKDQLEASNSLHFHVNGAERLTIYNNGIATFSSGANFGGSINLQQNTGSPFIRVHADTTTSPAPEIQFMRGTNDTWGSDNYTDWKIVDNYHLEFSDGTSGTTTQRLKIWADGTGLTVNGAYKLPGVDGTNGQVLTTDGADAVSWATPSGGGGSVDADTNLASNPRWTMTDTSGIGLEIYSNQTGSNMDNDLLRVRHDSIYADAPTFTAINDGGDQTNLEDFSRCFAVGAQATGEGVTYPLQIINGRNASNNYAGVGLKFKLSGWGNTEEGRKFSSISVESTTTWSRQHKMVFRLYGSNNSNQDTDIAMTIKSDLEIDGNFNDTSDRALKSNIINIPNGLEMVEKLRPVTFNWDIESNKMPSAGFIAQEVEEILPDLVRGEEGEKTIKTAGIVGYLVKAVQELSARVKELEGGN